MSKKSELVRGYGLAMSIGAMMDEVRREQGVTEEEFHVLGTPEGRPHLEKMIMGLKSPAPETPKPVYLRQMYADEEIALDPTDGLNTIARAKEVFKWGIDGDFTNWHLDVPAQPTKAVKVSVHEMFEQDGMFAQIYVSLGHPLDRLCLTQHQIIDFCVKYHDKLCQEGYGTFFLFKVGEEYFVADVRVRSDGPLLAFVDRFSRAGVWRAEARRRFVIPQLDAQVA